MAREGTFVAELLKRIRMEGPAAYGRNETEKAVEMGAAETLLVSVDMVREFEELMEKAEKTGAKIVVISGDHELGGQLLQIGGIGALLRFRV
jgi:protein pelota